MQMGSIDRNRFAIDSLIVSQNCLKNWKRAGQKIAGIITTKDVAESC